MKLSTYLQIFLIIAGFMFIFGLMAQESKENYPDANINDSAWVGKFDYSGEINDSIQPVKTALENIGDEEKGWFVKILSGIAAIPSAVIGMASLILGSFVHGGAIITGSLTILAIPATIIAIILIMILVWGIIKLVEIYQRWQI